MRAHLPAFLLCVGLTHLLIQTAAAQTAPTPTAHTSSAAEPSFTFGPALRFRNFRDFALGVELIGVSIYGETVTTTLEAGPNPEGRAVSAELSYARPVDLTLTEPATLRTSASSTFTQRYPLGTDPLTAEARTFTEDLSELSVALTQPLSTLPFGDVQVGVEGRVTDAQTFLEGEGEAAQDLPADSFGALVVAHARAEGIEEGTPRPTAQRPVGGAAEVAFGYGLGQADAPLSWAQAEVGLRGYLDVGSGVVLAGRANAGTNLGAAPTWRRLTPALRGYDTYALVGASAFDASLDVRYYTGLDAALGGPSFLRGVTPYLFADAGNAWGEGYRTPDLGGGVQFDAGAGLHLSLETQYFTLPLNVWYAYGAQGGKVGFAADYPY